MIQRNALRVLIAERMEVVAQDLGQEIQAIAPGTELSIWTGQGAPALHRPDILFWGLPLQEETAREIFERLCAVAARTVITAASLTGLDRPTVHHMPLPATARDIRAQIELLL